MQRWTRFTMDNFLSYYIVSEALDEAASFKFGEPIRNLFLSILVLNHPNDPLKFYSDHRLFFFIIVMMMMINCQ